MNRKDSKKSKKIRKLIVFCSLTSFIFIVATYAWFIGMRQVNVSSFEIEIASTDSLLLSLDGSKWDTTVTINAENFNDTTNTVYAGNVNNWAGIDTTVLEKGLKPISSVGEIDTTTSTMKMFEKGSLTATEGGYRLMASRIHNYDTPLGGWTTPANEGDDPEPIGQFKEIGGYVAFDLFIRNFSGRAYYVEDNVLNEEAIYLTDDSAVTVSESGVANAGIENSVRVAFAQIGRVNGKTTDVSKITGISCSDTADVTGICRTAQIWEPNDKAHTANAISYYQTSCKTRDNSKTVTNSDIATAGSGAYTSNACGAVANGTAYPTYAINNTINYTDRVDVYDGAAYNGYTKTTKAPESSEGANDAIAGPLEAYDYFTDSEKALNGMARPQLITLAPNSITKVRIYVWIEGQDIDNYDFASIGKQITVNFGFTKERFDEQGDDHMQGSGPYSATGDVARPVITGVPATKTLADAAAVNAFNANPMAGVTISDVGPETTENACTTAGGTWAAAPSRCVYTTGTNAGTVGSEATSEACAANTTDGGSWTTGVCYVNGLAGTQATQTACTADNGTWLTNTCTHDLTTKVQVTNPVTTTAGTYVVRYLVSDWQGNYAEAATTVTVSGS